ncbi:integrin beta-3-like [Scyliorhinus canicula]|uniref:integrin beta-3-like n=1 Tax=Scyliorhinus canicula TaxID=7830 RepID=UPI0018F56A77|nr:integrin beta-3-like [Scyliorhinus canicula]
MGTHSLGAGQIALLAALCITAVRGNNKCQSRGAATCTECLQIDPLCAWCSQKDFGESSSLRCDLKANLIQKGCRENATVFPQSTIRIVTNVPLSDKESSARPEDIVQFSPQNITISMRRGESVSFTVKVRQVEDYPVDIYYLMDLSFSMNDDLQTIGDLGTQIANELKKLTSKLQLGFGAFVDKPLSPYMYMTTEEEIADPCHRVPTSCAPMFGYINVLKLTEEVSKFNDEVTKQKVSRNRDTPEGGMDAILQAAVCNDDIGWRNDATHMLVFVTDADSHLALDGRLAGITRPNDGQCHLGLDNQYNASTILDYPSLALLIEKLTENNIFLFFAVTDPVKNIYKSYSNMIPGSNVEVLSRDSSNVLNLIVKAYQDIRSKAEMEVVNLPKELSISFDAFCGNAKFSEGSKSCSGLNIGDTVNFTVTLEAVDCPKDGKSKTFIVKPILFKDTLEVTVNFNCDCDCENSANESITQCTNGNGTYECGVCKCLPGRLGPKCECGESDSSATDQATCSPVKGDPICNNRGECICGQCVCHNNEFGIISGKYCECDDFSCGRFKGKLCSGNGKCECGECRCFANWYDIYCNCTTNTDSCITAVGSVCSRRGSCVCGKCVCQDAAYGDHCEKCPTCPDACSIKSDCVRCKVFDTGELKKNGTCHKVCTDEIRQVKDLDTGTANGVICSYKDENGCTVHFRYEEEENGNSVLTVVKEPVCQPPVNILLIVLCLMAAILLCGLLALLIWKLVVTLHDQREFAKFEAERASANWANANNPLYKAPTTTFTNLTYTGNTD